MNSAFFRRSSAEIESLHVLLLPAGTETTCALHRGEAHKEQSRTKAAVTFFFLNTRASSCAFGAGEVTVQLNHLSI